MSIVFLVLLSSIVFVLDTYAIPASIHVKLRIVDNVILLIFALEYLLRLWCAERKINYIFSLYSIIDLMAILPYFIGVVDISFIRLLRWFRILRLIRFVDRKILTSSARSPAL